MAGTGSTIGCVRAGFGVTDNQELRWKRTKDLLYTYSVPVPPNLYSSTFASVGTIDNSGIELTIASTPVTTRNFRWDLGATVSHNRNELVRFSNDQYEMVEIKTGYFADDLKMYTMRIVEGEPLGNFWGPKFLGFDAAGGAVYEDLDGASLRFVGEYPETCRKDVALRTFLLGLCDSSAAFLDFSRRGRFQCVEHPACGGRGALRHVRGFSRRSGIGAGSGRIDQLFRCSQRRSAVHFPWRGLIAAAIVMNGLAYRMARTGKRKLAAKGLLISVAAGTIMAFFYRFVASSMDLDSFTAPAAGKMIPYIVPFRAILSGDIRKNEKPYVFQYVRHFVPLHSFRLLPGRKRDSGLLLVFSMYQYVAMYLLFYSVPRLSDFDFWLYPIIYILQFFRENLRCKQFTYPPMTGFSHLQAKRIFGKQPVYGPCKFHCIRIRCLQTRFTV